MNSYHLAKGALKLARKINKTGLEWKLKRQFPAFFFQPHMAYDEYQLFRKLCQDKKVFLEYGSGGSTIFFLKEKKKLFSVESNPEFYEYMKSIRLVQRAMGKNLDFNYINLGPTNKWGKPLTSENDEFWQDYYVQVWEDIDPTKKVDVIFIDGRFRVCCCLYSILKVLEYGWNDTLIIIHDFWRRKKYHVVLPFLHEVESASNLAAFTIRDAINVEEVKEKLQEYALIYA